MDDAERLYACLETYYTTYEEQNNAMWVNKLGLDEFKESDAELIRALTSNLQLVETDMTIFFRLLCSIEEPSIEHLQDAFYDETTIPKEQWNQWLQSWWERVEGNPNRNVMLSTNPKYVFAIGWHNLRLMLLRKMITALLKNCINYSRIRMESNLNMRRSGFKSDQNGHDIELVVQCCLVQVERLFLFPTVALCQFFADQWVLAMWA